jgi:hypothetical protein
MNIILINCAEHEILLKAIKAIEDDGIWIIKKVIDYNEYKRHYSDFNSEFESFYDHIRLKKKNYNYVDYNNLTTSLISYSQSYVKTAIDLLQIRHTKKGISFSVDEYTDLFYSSLSRSMDEIISNDVDLVIFNHVPHHFNTYVLYIAAKFLNKKTLIFTKLSWNGFRYFLDIDVGFKGWSIKRKILCNNNISCNDLKYFDEIRNRHNYKKPSYMLTKYNRNIVRYLDKYFGGNLLFNVGILLYGGVEIGLFKRTPNHYKSNIKEPFTSEKYSIKLIQILNQLKNKFLINNLSKIYKKYASIVRIDEYEYVLFAPNYQPEATTLPSASYYCNILLCIKLLRSRIPKNVYIFYKEHEDIFNIDLESHRCRSEIFYKNLLDIENLIILDRRISQIDLIDNAKFVTIQTSNIGLDAIIRGKPVLNFGPTWFDEMPGMMDWDTFSDKSNYEMLANLQFELDTEIFSSLNKYTINFDEKNKSADLLNQTKKLFLSSLSQ